jgi:hypothetical protein
MEQESLQGLPIPKRIWIEGHASDPDARDIIIEMEDGTIFTSVFVTLDYLKRQMELTCDLCKQMPDTVPSRFVALDTPHIAVESLQRDTIEDTIDNLIAMEIFESVFTQVTDTPALTTSTTSGNSHRATQDVAAVVISDVLVVEE